MGEGLSTAVLSVAALLTAVATMQRAVRIREGLRRVAGLEQELARLRNLPLEEDLHVPPEAEGVESEQS